MFPPSASQRARDVRIDVRPAADVGVAAGGREHDVAVRQVDRVDIVVIAAGQLTQIGAVEPDLVQMEALFVVSLVAEQRPLTVERHVRAPVAAGFLRAQLPGWRAWVKPFQNQQPPTGHGSVAQPMDGLVLPLGPFGVRLVDAQQLREVQQRVLEHDPPFELADGQVSLPDGCPAERLSGDGGRTCSQGVEFRQIPGEVRSAGVPGQTSRQLTRPPNLLMDPLQERMSLGLKQPIRYQRGIARLRIAHRQVVFVQQVASGLLSFLLAEGLGGR